MESKMRTHLEIWREEAREWRTVRREEEVRSLGWVRMEEVKVDQRRSMFLEALKTERVREKVEGEWEKEDQRRKR